jgi:hypothetical protein
VLGLFFFGEETIDNNKNGKQQPAITICQKKNRTFAHAFGIC